MLEQQLDDDIEKVSAELGEGSAELGEGPLGTGLGRSSIQGESALERQQRKKKQQRHTLMLWVNAKLKATGQPPVADLIEGLNDGVVLAALLESLFTDVNGLREQMVVDHGDMPSFKLQNVQRCFRVIEQYGLKTTGLAPIDFVNEKAKFVGTFCWELMRKVERLPKISQDSDKIPKSILRWLNAELGEAWLAKQDWLMSEGGEVIGPEDFQNGRVLAALFETRHPIAPAIGEGVSDQARNDMALAAFRKQYGITEAIINSITTLLS